MDFINKNIYYLNIAELKKICSILGIDYYYYIKYNNKLIRGRIVKKIVIIRNIFRVLAGNNPVKIIIPERVVNFHPLKNPKKTTRIYYGQYINGNKQILNLMKKLTNNKFVFGVIAQDILFDHWRRGKLLTFGELANRWLKYKSKRHPEWQYIDYIRTHGTSIGWSKYRAMMAKSVMKKIIAIYRKIKK